ncbi:hypothetical protein [Clostridium perfringens]|nr:hypothetical protein [Clostridium perfringens]MDK0693204.1 hypothetical protein [Clostridium perfringens]MDM0611183.1 hypothetical protein [Clostridium perfringens]MDU4603621.1 hypothetical protein [Clostridium perfringens]MDU4829802.1 hypothetical protein [Clostridium perfringens]WEV19873.1 hypothetical protein PL323_04395 [Clostridium perfringens D]
MKGATIIYDKKIYELTKEDVEYMLETESNKGLIKKQVNKLLR